ncbi:MAG: primosomal protein N' [Pseudomonadota bacterium]
MAQDYLRIALNGPFYHHFDYLPPQEEEPACLVGCRVLVPFARTRKIGVVVALVTDTAVKTAKLRRVLRCLDEAPLLSEADLACLDWIARYYQYPPGEVMLAALPVRLRKRQKALAVPPQAEQPVCRVADYPLNAEQQAAIQAVQAQLGQFAVFLLEGVTGSGKTEVYLQLAQQVLAREQCVLLLVPEIALTPQLQQRFTERFTHGVSVLHSGLNDTERERAWHQVRLGLTPFVVGTRSSVLNPIPCLGLVIVDEEHEPAYKQQDGLRYSARDMAVIRAQRAGCPVILGSATPSLESMHNVAFRGYQRLRLQQRAGSALPPDLHLLDIRDQPLSAGLSEPLLTALQDTLAAGEQAIIFINRRGYAPVLTCYSCDWISECAQCDAYQTVHRAQNVLRCHHCSAQHVIPRQCPACAAYDLHPLGQGTERVGDFLRDQFPEVPLLRIDRDATSQKGSLQALLDQVHAAEAAILVGTQMLAKGHHFPHVTLVGILNADGGLYSADFRGSERMAQLLMQVAGRAGRGDRPGQVLIQTRHPDHPVWQTLLREGYPAFAQAALAEREAAGYPPYAHQVLIRAEAKQAEPPERFLQQVAAWVQQQSTVVTCWGPVPAPMARRVGKYRVHLLLQSARRQCVQALARALRDYLQAQSIPRGISWSLDVDPV